jgi:hypothetical protein
MVFLLDVDGATSKKYSSNKTRKKENEMTATVWQRRVSLQGGLALIGVIGAIGSASAAPPVVNTSGLTPEQCYRRDSQCTEFCGRVTGDLRYECFAICDRMLDNCLTTGDWDDSPAALDPGEPKSPGRNLAELSSLLIRIVMALGDDGRDGDLPTKEIEALKAKVFEKEEGGGDKKQTTPKQR